MNGLAAPLAVSVAAAIIASVVPWHPHPARGVAPATAYAQHLTKAPNELELSSTFTPLTGTVLQVPPASRPGAGGAVTSVGSILVVLSHDGEIFAVTPSHQIAKTRIAAPYNGFQHYVNDSQLLPHNQYTHNFAHFRYNDIQFIRTTQRTGFAVSYTKYHVARRCYTTTISFLRIPAMELPIEQWSSEVDEWQDIFESTPCLPLKKEFRAIEGHMAGGRLVFDGKQTLYLASGDYSWDGIYGPESVTKDGLPLAQDPDTDYGKVIRIDLNRNSSERLSSGQRNMQGIALDRDGNVWTVEHGMRGGDELNRIVAGRNYGWPLESYGTLYSGLPNPMALSNGRHTNFEKPIFAWLPSIAVSSLTLIEGFHDAWDGDLLVATLAAMKLVRVRIEAGRVVFAEDIPVGRRIRHVHQHDTGTIVLWTDTRELIFLRPHPRGFEDKFLAYLLDKKVALADPRKQQLLRAINQCRGCHSFSSGDNSKAPSLARILGAGIGSGKFAGYSEAVKRHGGVWTKESLTSYIRAPQTFIPGTTMPDPALDDEEMSAEIVNILEHFTLTIETPPEYK